MKQIYHCSACRYTFEAEPYIDFPASCPDCGKVEVHPADEAQIKEYKRVQLELLQDADFPNPSCLPNYRTREEVEAALREQGCDLTHKAFYDTVKERFGSRGLRQARDLIEKSVVSFRDPNFPLVDVGVMLTEMKELFIESKEIAREKYTSKKYRKANQEDASENR